MHTAYFISEEGNLIEAKIDFPRSFDDKLLSYINNDNKESPSSLQLETQELKFYEVQDPWKAFAIMFSREKGAVLRGARHQNVSLSLEDKVFFYNGEQPSNPGNIYHREKKQLPFNENYNIACKNLQIYGRAYFSSLQEDLNKTFLALSDVSVQSYSGRSAEIGFLGINPKYFKLNGSHGY